MIKRYNTEKYRFHDIVAAAFEIEDLSKIHCLRQDFLPQEKLVFDNESKTKFHQHFYDLLNSGKLPQLERSYFEFVRDEVGSFFNEDVLYQYMPSFRVHLPGDKAIHKWHYDSDSDHRHPEWEINFHIPLTRTYDTQSIWIESVPGLGDFSPMNLEYGEFCVFDGNRCMHGNKENTTEQTRVSFDFRVMPVSKFSLNQKESVTSNKKFIEGQYYRRVPCTKA